MYSTVQERQPADTNRYNQRAARDTKVNQTPIDNMKMPPENSNHISKSSDVPLATAISNTLEPEERPLNPESSRSTPQLL